LKVAIFALLGLWLAWNIAGLFWRAYLTDERASDTIPAPINDLGGAPLVSDSTRIDLQRMLNWHLFGNQSDEPVKAAVVISNAETDMERDASETRLKLLLRGVVASDEGEAGRAMIESQGRQELYSVGEKLPVGGRVTVARILPDRVILDNTGKYELLRLFEEKTKSVGALQAPAPEPIAAIKNDPEVAKMAGDYRQRLYSNPQSLADVVKISAVRKGGQMQGYRVSPGRDRDQFTALGFKSNDIVTSVNGIELNDPAKAMELYRLMRSASEASFTVQRGDAEETVSVSLGNITQ
jgi:general secretion pathway protein C